MPRMSPTSQSLKQCCTAQFARVSIACALAIFGLATPLPVPAQTLETLASFNNTNGAKPYGPLVQGLDGKFYGTTSEGGGNGSICQGAGCGTLFNITPQGALKTLHLFCSEPKCSDGFSPLAGLLLTAGGDLYGTTAESGDAYLTGTVFDWTAGGSLVTLQNFLNEEAEFPNALTRGTDGDLYGTAAWYGTTLGAGGIFKLNSSGALTTVHQFQVTDGAHPLAPLLLASDGNFYGTTSGQCGRCGDGTIFKLSPDGTLVTLHTFKGSDGSNPEAGLVEGRDGDLYGTTVNGGSYANCTYVEIGCGTVFQITRTGTFTSLHSFDGKDGANPYGGLVLGTDGNFYGTTANYTEVGGGSGTIFKITPDGTLTTLHAFQGTDGQFPFAGLMQATDGNFYGTTLMGGRGFGTVFKLSVGLGPFVTTVPAFAAVGSSVAILGTNLTGATKVTFDGVEATFTVESATEITATVPSGAKTGIVEVTLPGGTLKSNVVFYVLP